MHVCIHGSPSHVVPVSVSAACQQDGLSVSWGSGVVESLRGGLGLQRSVQHAHDEEF